MLEINLTTTDSGGLYCYLEKRAKFPTGRFQLDVNPKLRSIKILLKINSSSISSFHQFIILKYSDGARYFIKKKKKKSPSRSLRSPHTIRARPACEDGVVFFLLIPPRKFSAQHYKKFSANGSGAYLSSHLLTTSTVQ